MNVKYRAAAILPILVVLAVQGVAYTAAPANAYAKTGCKWNKTTVNYSTVPNSAYVGPTDAAAAAWNVTATPIVLHKYAGSPIGGIEIIAHNYGNVGWDGYSHWTCSSGKTSAEDSEYNTYYTDGYSATGKKQVMVHEFGHDWGLAHAGSSKCSGQPIMYASSDRYFTCNHSTPQSDDINGINSIY